MDLFHQRINNQDMPLALRMCPESLSEFVGQGHILGENKLLRRLIETDRISSLIFYGPSGCGKSALANVIAKRTSSNFVSLNAVTCGVADLRREIKNAYQRRVQNNKKTILLIEEIHHFNKTQQDALLPNVEKGIIVLIGITTHNPCFYLNSALISRSVVFEFKSLNEKEIETILTKAMIDFNRGLGKYKINVEKEALKHLIGAIGGDARKALNALELGVISTLPDKKNVINFTLSVSEESIQKKVLLYDKKEDEHFDTISAFIKSMRGSDPDAALYWLAKMIYAGEDPRFIARRIAICASEDVGNADPQAICVAAAALKISELVGMPEAKIPLAQAAIYIACAPKSNASYLGIEAALKDIEEGKIMKVPVHLKDAHSGKFGHGKDYKYPHEFTGHYVQQEYLPEKRNYYNPTEEGYESKIKKRLISLMEKNENR
ncbi:replication-associated recombination protein A [bacterium]|nr:replication-associated recombination protein A [bacterium]